MYLSAYVRDNQRYLVIPSSDYTSKKAFAYDLRANGYSVIRISNNRDLAAQDHNYESFAAMKALKKLYDKNTVLWKDELERLANIESIEL